jgi:HprK-related kinase B
VNGQPREYADRLTAGFPLVASGLTLRSGGCTLTVRSNSSGLIRRLARYFAHVRVEDETAGFTVIAIEREAPDVAADFVDWRREPGKTGRKDSYMDLDGGRLVRKVRTGMVFLQSRQYRVAAGPCLANDNQVINFINAQWMNRLQQLGWLICHAAGLVHGDTALAIAGLSGGGKSTLMLRLLERAGFGYLTNDRLFVRRGDAGLLARGIPKLPRVNPGTIVHSARLRGLIPEHRRKTLLALPVDELWALEEKHDVMIDEIYGPGRVVGQAPLAAFVVLNWQRDSRQPTALTRVCLADRRDLLGALMKSPGPFYQTADGGFLADDTPLDPEPYLAMLGDLPVYEASGRLDFAHLADEIARLGGTRYA